MLQLDPVAFTDKHALHPTPSPRQRGGGEGGDAGGPAGQHCPPLAASGVYSASADQFGVSPAVGGREGGGYGSRRKKGGEKEEQQQQGGEEENRAEHGRGGEGVDTHEAVKGEGHVKHDYQ